MMRLLLLLFMCCSAVQAQAVTSLPDSVPAARDLPLHTVTSHTDNRLIEDNLIDIRRTGLPVMIIDKKTIALMGSRRLDEVLREQTGLAMVSDLGTGNRSIGLQMQGFGAAYVTVLLDGQPMTGRSNGNFDLSRISISNIERIEIIKGASSSLYGSDALGGTVNIITRQQISHREAAARVMYGTYQSLDASLDGSTPIADKGAVMLSGNYYRTGGFNVNPYLSKESRTSPPYHSISLQGRGKYTLSNSTEIVMFSRYAGRSSVMTRNYGAMPTRDALDEHDGNGMIALKHRLQHGGRLIARYYYTRYQSAQEVTLQNSHQSLQENTFSEQLHRTEVQFSNDYLRQRLGLTAGAGAAYQVTDAVAGGAGGHQYNYFAYVQSQWQAGKPLQLTAGLRYDGNSMYGGRLNPSAGVRYTPVKWITLRGSVGMGFRSPAYRQLYQVFTNADQGYTVVGANVFAEGIAALRQAGLVQQLWTIANDVKPLKAETSTSWNAGIELQPATDLEVGINGFYNSIRHLINHQQVGVKTNGAQLFSFININSAYTGGMEATVAYTLLHHLSFSAGYQLLYARDRTVLDSIRQHAPRYSTVRSNPIRAARPADYFGLPGRSRHMVNAQVNYTYQPWKVTFSLRGNYRSKYGFLDTDNNGYIDPFDIYVKGYVLVYTSMQKKLLKDQLTLQLAVDNCGNYTDYLMPAQPGRMIMAGAGWKVSGNRKPHSKTNTDAY